MEDESVYFESSNLLIMKIFLSVLSVFVFCAPWSEAAEFADAELNTRALQRIRTILNTFSTNCEHVSSNKSSPIFKMFGKSVDEKCVLDEYIKKDKRQNLIDDIHIESGINATVSYYSHCGPNLNSTETTTKFLKQIYYAANFISVAASCSDKLKPLAEYVFEMLMAQGIIYRAFADEPEFKDFPDIINCLNRLAIRQNLVDLDSFQLRTDMDEDAKTSCAMILFTFKYTFELKVEIYTAALLKVIPDADEKCFENHITSLKKFVFKYFSMMQFEMTPEQKQKEKMNFIKDIRDILATNTPCIDSVKLQL